ncbi:MAG: hypothetical protein H0T75_21245 [Rhizobiales bacterium]|nr:hypothetical protein [Hyphomicrobiales bacterium]
MEPTLDNEAFAAALARLEIVSYLREIALPEYHLAEWNGLGGKEYGFPYAFDALVTDHSFQDLTEDQIKYFGFSYEQVSCIQNF